jgi:NADPH:quinone reductase-like Zn-dependent oxidoreductase
MFGSISQSSSRPNPQRYDQILDNVGTHSLLEYKRVLNPKGIYVMIGSTTPGNWFVKGLMLSPFVSRKFGMILGGTQQRGPGHPGRSHAVREGHTGHRPALQTE